MADAEDVGATAEETEDVEMGAQAGGAAEGEDDSAGKGKADPEAEAEGAEKDAEMQEPEAAKELEEDAPLDARVGPLLERGVVSVDTSSSTLNCMASCNGQVLLPFTEGGFLYLTAAARANTGIKKGRYFFEVKPIEGTRTYPSQDSRPRQSFGFGFSAGAKGPLFLGTEGSAGFDSEGNVLQDARKTKVVAKSSNHLGAVFGVLVNLDQSSPNANTISLFRDGVRACPPQPLPEGMLGKTLYPVVNYKNYTLRLNFGPEPTMPLPFRCRMLQGASKADVETLPLAGNTKQEVLFPVGLPDEGTFDWLDGFLEENPQYDELSDRALLSWCEKSSLTRLKGYSAKNTNDRPGIELGIRELDDGSTRKRLYTMANLLKKNYVVMEVRNNLMTNERKKLLGYFDSPDLKKVAVVVMGEPPAKVKEAAMQQLLQQKRDKAEQDVRKKRAAEDSTKVKEENEDTEEPQESLEAAIQKAVEAVELTEQDKQQWFRKREVEDINRKELSKQFANFTIPTEEEGFDEIRFAWQPLEGCQSYLKAWVSEKKMTTKVEDLQPGAWFTEHWTTWIGLLQAWKRRHAQWNDPAAKEHREDMKKQAMERLKRKQEQARKKEAEANVKPENEEAEMDVKPEDEEVELEVKSENGTKVAEDDFGSEGFKEEADVNEGIDDITEAKELKEETEVDAVDEAIKEEQEASLAGDVEEKEQIELEDEEEKEELEDEPEAMNVESVDVYSVQDIDDVDGKGEPLYANFEYEDWTLLTLRAELHLLVHGFRHDVNDPERASFPDMHLGFYYQKYFRKNLNVKSFNVSGITELLRLVRDAVEVDPKTSILEAMLCDDTPWDNFIKLTEDGRRERQRIIDAGDETAILKFTRPPQAPVDQGNRARAGDRGPNSGHGGKGRGGKGHNYGKDANKSGYPSRGHVPGPVRGAPPQGQPRYYDPRTQPVGVAAPHSRYPGYVPPPPMGNRGGYYGGGHAGAAQYGGYPGQRGAPLPPPGRGYAAPPPGRGYGSDHRGAPMPGPPSAYSGRGEKRGYPDSGQLGYGPTNKQARPSSYGAGGPASRAPGRR